MEGGTAGVSASSCCSVAGSSNGIVVVLVAGWGYLDLLLGVVVEVEGVDNCEVV